jgi:protein-S-isoprenylcysteine O-methyltransferase Ste14
MSRNNALFRWFLSSVALATMALLCAGKANTPALWVYLGIFSTSGLVTALIVDPSLLEERSNSGDSVLDPFIGKSTTFLFLLTVAVAALDSGRFHWTKTIGLQAQTAALVFLVVMTALQIWAMTVNPFFSTRIRVQHERGHHVITRGPYRLVRHPGYFAMFLIMPLTAFSLGSCAALIPASLYSAVILRRTTQEDDFLRNQLHGYPGYIARVRCRLFAGLW